jgi:hypothetical protein
MSINLELNALTYVVNIEYVEEFSPLHRRSATIEDFQKGKRVLLWNKSKEKSSCIKNLRFYGLAHTLLKISLVINLIYSET